MSNRTEVFVDGLVSASVQIAALLCKRREVQGL